MNIETYVTDIGAWVMVWLSEVIGFPIRNVQLRFRYRVYFTFLHLFHCLLSCCLKILKPASFISPHLCQCVFYISLIHTLFPSIYRALEFNSLFLSFSITTIQYDFLIPVQVCLVSSYFSIQVFKKTMRFFYVPGISGSSSTVECFSFQNILIFFRK